MIRNAEMLGSAAHEDRRGVRIAAKEAVRKPFPGRSRLLGQGPPGLRRASVAREKRNGMVGFGQDRDEFPRRDAFSDLSDGLDSVTNSRRRRKIRHGLVSWRFSGVHREARTRWRLSHLSGAILFLGEVSEPIIGVAVGDRVAAGP